MFFPGPENMNKAFGVAVSADEGYAVVGTSFGAHNKIWLVKADSDGNQEWNKTYSITGGDSAFDIDNTCVNGIVQIVSLVIKGPYYTRNGIEYWIVVFGKRPMRLISNYY